MRNKGISRPNIQGVIVETKIEIGRTASVDTHVSKQNTAQAVGSGDLPVFSTPMLVALMEKAACAVLAGRLQEGQTSVGTGIQVKHISASPIGAYVSATAEIIAVEGRAIEFRLTASDEVAEIGMGTHTRMVVDSIKFINRVKQKHFTQD